MKISWNWLSEFVRWKNADPLAVAERLTLAVAEVEGVDMQGALLRGCCVGRVLTVEPHPNAERLKLATVETDRGDKRVVCGGSNLATGMLVAFAHVGARVRWHGEQMMTLERVKIRGEESEGMICAAEELDLTERCPTRPEDGPQPIINLSTEPGIKPGQPLREALGLTDAVFHISNNAIAQRPDLFAHLGVARECVALGIATWKGKGQPAYPMPKFPKTPLPFRSRTDCRDLVPRYCGCLIEIDDVGETPLWMKRRLEATGWRSVNLPVDITNYVSMEIGMPLHSFDADDLRGDVVIRTSRAGERITTLDEVERTLPEGAIVLSDDDGIFDLLGVMGGLRSSTKATTRRIYLHAAIVDPISIRRTIIATGHRTDASIVYEKGVPRISAEWGLARAIDLLLTHAPGGRIVSKLENYGTNGAPKAIALSIPTLHRTAGIEISATEAARILTCLGCNVAKRGSSLAATPPLWRIRDLKAEHDLIEEVTRLHGYDRIPDVMPSAPIRVPARESRFHATRDALRERGFCEIVPLSLLGAALLQRAGLDPAAAVAIENPITEDMALLQPSALPQLLDHAQRNILTAGDRIKTFHWTNVFGKDGEHVELALLHAALGEAPLTAEPVLALKGELRHALEAVGYALHVEPLTSVPTFAHPGRSGRIAVEGADGERREIGLICELHPEVRERFDLRGRAAAALLDMSVLFALKPAERFAEPLPGFPAVTYDLTVARSMRSAVGPVLRKLAGTHPLLTKVEVVDLFARGGSDYSLTLRCTYRAPDRTLTEEEAKTAHESVAAIAAGL